MRLAAAIPALVLLLAGCSSPPTDPAPPPEAPAEPPAAPAPTRVVHHVQGAYGPEAMTKVFSTLSPGTHNTTLEFEVPPGATGLVVELAWSDPATDLDMFLAGPQICGVPAQDLAPCIANAFFGDPEGTGAWRNDAGLPGQGDSPARLRLTAEELAPDACDGCQWRATVTTKATQGAAFHLYATVFHGAPPPEGYTAVAAQAG